MYINIDAVIMYMPTIFHDSHPSESLEKPASHPASGARPSLPAARAARCVERAPPARPPGGNQWPNSLVHVMVENVNPDLWDPG